MEEYEPIKVLGEGAFGKVYLMRQRKQRTLMCVKVIKIKGIPKKDREACRLEVRAARPTPRAPDTSRARHLARVRRARRRWPRRVARSGAGPRV